MGVRERERKKERQANGKRSIDREKSWTRGGSEAYWVGREYSVSDEARPQIYDRQPPRALLRFVLFTLFSCSVFLYTPFPSAPRSLRVPRRLDPRCRRPRRPFPIFCTAANYLSNPTVMDFLPIHPVHQTRLPEIGDCRPRVKPATRPMPPFARQ